jgi:hypothetical protein
MEEAVVAKEARKEALESQLHAVRSGKAGDVPAPDGTTQQGSPLGTTDEEKAARKAALESQLHGIRSGDVTPPDESGLEPAGGLRSSQSGTQIGSNAGIQSRTSPETPHSDAMRDDSKLQAAEAEAVDETEAADENEAAVAAARRTAAMRKREAALAWESAAHKAEFFARVAMFTKEAHEKALAEAEVEAAAAAAKKAAEEDARGAEQLSTALRMDARVSRRVLESSRLFDNAATDFKSRCCVSILWLVCVAMFLFVLLVAVRVAVKLCGADPSQCID